ncbi:MAG TPA: YciK family oxidoreductase [Gammaproteobacteria bacterium]|nr:YciK family oxidoreductase [Gammaproteobacteria bacterium]
MKIPADWQADENLLQQRIVLVTGAASGIGAAIARRAAAAGATLVLLDKSVPGLEQTYDAIESAGGPQPAIYPMDLEGASEKDYLDLAETLQREFGRLDALVHNAAMLGALIPLAHYDAELWLRIMQVNLNAPFLLTRCCLPVLMQAEEASVVFLSDTVARQGTAYWGAYGVSKAGLENLSQILAEETETNTRLRVNCLDPGPVATHMRSIAYPGEVPDRARSPEAVAEALLYLLGPESRGVSGQRFELNSDPVIV